MKKQAEKVLALLQFGGILKKRSIGNSNKTRIVNKNIIKTMDGLSLFTLREHLFPGPTKREASAFRDTVASNNLRRQRVLAPMVIAACLVLVVQVLFFMKVSRVEDRSVFLVSIMAQIVTAVFLTLFLYSTRDPRQPVVTGSRSWVKSFAFVSLFWAAFSSGMLASGASGSGPYIIAVLSIAAVLYLESVQGMILFALAPVFFVCSAMYCGTDRYSLGQSCASILAATLFAYIISRINFVMLLRNFRDAEYISGQQRELIASNERLHQLSFLDPLTNIANRRFLEMSLVREWKQQTRTNRPLSVIMIDIDWFKAYNDTYGHLAGDACLRLVASGLKASVKRPSDMVTRFGGEEFCVLLPETGREGAIRVGRRMLQAVRGLQMPHQGSSLGHVTASMGVACCQPDLSGRFEDLLAAADAALYTAKTAGKDRIAWCCLPDLLTGTGPGMARSRSQDFRIVDFSRARNAGKLPGDGTGAASFQAVRS